MITLFFQMPLFWLGIGIFGYFIYAAPEDCPKEYMTLKKDGGQLDNLGHIYKYCTPFDKNFRTWHLKETVTFDEILRRE